MRKILACAAVLAGFTAAAHAADLSADSVKDALPAIPDGPITWHGVTLYGTVDVGGFYAENGAPVSGAWYNGGNYTIYGARYANGEFTGITNNALEQSKVGLKIEENIGYGFQAIGKLETGFNPISGELADACASLLRNNGKTYSQFDANGDGSRCGQAFNGAAYGGLSNPLYGTLTIGRQNSLVNDGMGTYDPMALSYAFSLIGASGTPGAGIGSTETARWDNSIKYILSYGPVHAAGMYTNGGQDTPMMGDGYGANLGVTYAGLSIDGFYTKENGAVSLTSIPNPLYLAGATGNGNGVTSCVAGVNCPNALKGTITNNDAWDVMGKYSFDAPSLFGGAPVSMKDAPCGGAKDAPCAPTPAKVTIFGGYQYVTMSNPDHEQSYYSGFTTQNGYQFLTAGKLAYGSDKVLETAWTGLRYETGPWAFTGAYYYWGQNAYLNAKSENCSTASSGKINNGFGKQIASNCSGELNQGSFLIDYTFNKHFDIYAGVTVSEIAGGLSSGFLQTNDVSVASGFRVKF